MIYTRTSERTMFLLPAVAVGMDENGSPFMELAWLCWAIGIGEKP